RHTRSKRDWSSDVCSSDLGIDIQCTPRGGVRKIDRIHPGQSAVNGSTELSASIIISIGAPGLVLKSMSRAVGVVDDKPLFVATKIGRASCRERVQHAEV